MNIVNKPGAFMVYLGTKWALKARLAKAHRDLHLLTLYNHSSLCVL